MLKSIRNALAVNQHVFLAQGQGRRVIASLLLIGHGVRSYCVHVACTVPYLVNEKVSSFTSAIWPWITNPMSWLALDWLASNWLHRVLA